MHFVSEVNTYDFIFTSGFLDSMKKKSIFSHFKAFNFLM